MKSFLFILAVVITTAHAFSSDHREELMNALNDEVPGNLDAELQNFEDDKPGNDSAVPNPHNCDCDGVCEDLHYTRLPKDVRVRDK